VEPEKQPLLGNDCVTRNNGVMLEATFSVRPCRGYITKASCHYGTVLRRQLEQEEVSVRWPPACEDVSPAAKERPLLEDVTKQSSEDRE
jgi:hypothetical protein